MIRTQYSKTYTSRRASPPRPPKQEARKHHMFDLLANRRNPSTHSTSPCSKTVLFRNHAIRKQTYPKRICKAAQLCLGFPADSIEHGESHLKHPRNGPDRNYAHVLTGADWGEHWTGPFRHFRKRFASKQKWLGMKLSGSAVWSETTWVQLWCFASCLLGYGMRVRAEKDSGFLLPRDSGVVLSLSIHFADFELISFILFITRLRA